VLSVFRSVRVPLGGRRRFGGCGMHGSGMHGSGMHGSVRAVCRAGLDCARHMRGAVLIVHTDRSTARSVRAADAIFDSAAARRTSTARILGTWSSGLGAIGMAATMLAAVNPASRYERAVRYLSFLRRQRHQTKTKHQRYPCGLGDAMMLSYGPIRRRLHPRLRSRATTVGRERAVGVGGSRCGTA
jgi:hypothetical protein